MVESGTHPLQLEARNGSLPRRLPRRHHPPTAAAPRHDQPARRRTLCEASRRNGHPVPLDHHGQGQPERGRGQSLRGNERPFHECAERRHGGNDPCAGNRGREPADRHGPAERSLSSIGVMAFGGQQRGYGPLSQTGQQSARSQRAR